MRQQTEVSHGSKVGIRGYMISRSERSYFQDRSWSTPRLKVRVKAENLVKFALLEMTRVERERQGKGQQGREADLCQKHFYRSVAKRKIQPG